MNIPIRLLDSAPNITSDDYVFRGQSISKLYTALHKFIDLYKKPKGYFYVTTPELQQKCKEFIDIVYNFIIDKQTPTYLVAITKMKMTLFDMVAHLDPSFRSMVQIHHSGLPFNLFIGSISGSADIAELQANNISHVINCAFEVNINHPNIVCQNLPLEDLTTFPISIHVPSVIDFIDAACKGGKPPNILIACYGGINRSGYMVIEVLKHYTKMNPVDALFAILKSRGNQILTNPHFFRLAMFSYPLNY